MFHRMSKLRIRLLKFSTFLIANEKDDQANK